MSDQKPEVPPNCPYFRKSADGKSCFVQTVKSVVGQDTVTDIWSNLESLELFEISKPIIAAVGETYWRKESRRLDVELVERCERNIARSREKAHEKESTGPLRFVIERADSQAILWQQMNDPASPLWETFR